MPESPDCGSWARWRSDPIRRARPGVVGWDVELGHRAERDGARQYSYRPGRNTDCGGGASHQWTGAVTSAGSAAQEWAREGDGCLNRLRSRHPLPLSPIVPSGPLIYLEHPLLVGLAASLSYILFLLLEKHAGRHSSVPDKSPCSQPRNQPLSPAGETPPPASVSKSPPLQPTCLFSLLKVKARLRPAPRPSPSPHRSVPQPNLGRSETSSDSPSLSRLNRPPTPSPSLPKTSSRFHPPPLLSHAGDPQSSLSRPRPLSSGNAKTSPRPSLTPMVPSRSFLVSG